MQRSRALLHARGLLGKRGAPLGSSMTLWGGSGLTDDSPRPCVPPGEFKETHISLVHGGGLDSEAAAPRGRACSRAKCILDLGVSGCAAPRTRFHNRTTDSSVVTASRRSSSAPSVSCRGYSVSPPHRSVSITLQKRRATGSFCATATASEALRRRTTRLLAAVAPVCALRVVCDAASRALEYPTSTLETRPSCHASDKTRVEHGIICHRTDASLEDPTCCGRALDKFHPTPHSADSSGLAQQPPVAGDRGQVPLRGLLRLAPAPGPLEDEPAPRTEHDGAATAAHSAFPAAA